VCNASAFRSSSSRPISARRSGSPRRTTAPNWRLRSRWRLSSIARSWSSRAIIGQELECAVLGNDDPWRRYRAKILPSREFYDYEDNICSISQNRASGADIGGENGAELRRSRSNAIAPVDVPHGESRFPARGGYRELYINEINTIPGFTSISMYPKMWSTANPYVGADRSPDRAALERTLRKNATRFTR